MENYISLIAPLLIGLACMLVAIPVRKYVTGKMHNEDVDRYVKQVVKFVEQVAANKTSEEKLKIARDLLKKYFPSLTDENVDVIIEASVKEMKVAWDYVTKIKQPLSFSANAIAPVRDAQFWNDLAPSIHTDYTGDEGHYDDDNDEYEKPEWYMLTTPNDWIDFDKVEVLYEYVRKMYFTDRDSENLYVLFDEKGYPNNFSTMGELLDYVQNQYDALKPKEGADENS